MSYHYEFYRFIVDEAVVYQKIAKLPPMTHKVIE